MRTVSEGLALELLHIHFKLDAPVAFEDVKKKYKQESKRLHPDLHPGTDGIEEAFKALSGAYDSLKQLYQLGSRLFDAEPLEDVVEGEPKPPSMPRTTIDGTPLSDLGLGLGPTTNGRECARCEQRGYTILREHGRMPCPKCGGRNMFNGRGEFQYPFRNMCTACNGTGKSPTERVTRIIAMKCGDCKGTGEIEIANPALPKGRLTFVGTPPASQVDIPTSQPATIPNRSGKGRLLKEDPNRMQSLLKELRAKGVGGKR